LTGRACSVVVKVALSRLRGGRRGSLRRYIFI